MTDVAVTVASTRRERSLWSDVLVPVPPPPRRDGRGDHLRADRFGRRSSARCSTPSIRSTSTCAPATPCRRSRIRWAPTTSAATSSPRCCRAAGCRCRSASPRCCSRCSLGTLIGVLAGYFPPARRPADAADRPVPRAAAAAAAARHHHAVPRHAARHVRARDRDLPADRLHHRRHLVDADRARSCAATCWR